ncbi:LysR family transcriptional regulator [Xanthomonas arboricola pv. juglandis]|uniref:HTH-type transcriptional regulator PgrR n=2 Tax=Xanthomonas arboricola TaxID=56448 RepID=A0A8D6VCJ3_9XANT|nr:LysR family transcriptional regulator [Xanthomonas arboricola]CAE6750040.1 HTH-type transcriptional regulator PgrR [Xanthomonas arboricola pv. corylina]CAE6750063.1 HTH-type transcriptional regulator PgrR [Xanthomonas arboricola pv. corylina]CAE6801095.1 HTH-type transcriptional regulator PgrR [Xanthomonas arboricola pv. corylina]CAE6801121.1 HTH-type transcriptional regulator PgrR [Xanthomonas arboricola pv. corylina]
MARENLNDLQVFVTVAREGSFTRAAVQLGVSQSALSHTVRALETRLGIRLLTRTTRSVSMTEAGARLFDTVAPRLEEIDDELSALTDFRDKPAGTIRITTAGHAADAYIWPALSNVLPDYPDLKIEVTVDYGLADIVAERYDIGIRLGEQVAKDMIAVPISPMQRMAVVAVPNYFVHHTIPAVPAELARHNCIGLRLPTHGGLLPWDFEKDGRKVKVRVGGQWTFNGSSACVPRWPAADSRSCRKPWCWSTSPPAGYAACWRTGASRSMAYAYYPNRRQSSRALKVVIDALRHDLTR